MELSSTTIEDFQNNIKSWVQLDNKIQEIQQGLRELRDQKSDLGIHLYQYAQDNDLDDAIIKISDGKLKFQTTRTSQPLSFKFVEECLQECLKDEERVKQIMIYIKNAREVKEHRDLKRYYNKK